MDPLPFAVGLMMAAWLSGYLAGWVFFRYRNFWGVFALGAVGLMSNLTFLPDTASIYLAIYVFTGLLLVGWVQSMRSRQRWDAEGRIYDGHLGILTVSDTSIVAIVALVIAFLLPVGGQWGPANAFYSLTRAPLVSWEEDFNRLFAGLPARRPLPYRIWGDTMAFPGHNQPHRHAGVAGQLPGAVVLESAFLRDLHARGVAIRRHRAPGTRLGA